MSDTTTKTEEVEQGDHINRDDVATWDAEDSDKRYKEMNTSPRNSRDGQEGYLLKDRETCAIHVTNLDTSFLQPNYRVNATDVSLFVNERDMTDVIIDELSRAVQYDHSINMDTVRIEYYGESGWEDEVGSDHWDVEANVTTAD